MKFKTAATRDLKACDRGETISRHLLQAGGDHIGTYLALLAKSNLVHDHHVSSIPTYLKGAGVAKWPHP